MYEMELGQATAGGSCPVKFESFLNDEVSECISHYVSVRFKGTEFVERIHRNEMG